MYSALYSVVYYQEWCRARALTPDKRFSLPLCCLQGLKHWRRKCTPASPALPPCLRAASRLACNHIKNVSSHRLKSYNMCVISCALSQHELPFKLKPDFKNLVQVRCCVIMTIAINFFWFGIKTCFVFKPADAYSQCVQKSATRSLKGYIKVESTYHFLCPSKSKKPGFGVLHFPTLAWKHQRQKTSRII